MTIIYYPRECPKCRCRDIREEFWGNRCFKCGYFEPRQSPTADVYPRKQKESDNG